MSTARPACAVYNPETGKPQGNVGMPHVLMSPIRPDVVDFVHKLMIKNTRQAYAVSTNAGYQTPASSWGTGRAVARIPRVPGGGTHRAGQGAFGNMCRGGGMFCPTKIWRRWHRKINVTQRRHAVASSLASSAVAPLVMARGHRIDDVPELPLVVDNSLESFTKTKQVYSTMQKLGLKADLDRVLANRKVRAGKGKARGRKYKTSRGPLIVYNNDDGIVKAAKNIPGLDVVNVNSLNLLKLAPGGHLGRMVVWTEDAVKACKKHFGTFTNGAQMKKGYHLPRAAMTNADLSKIINSEEVQSVVRAARVGMSRPNIKKNPLKSPDAMDKVNPGETKRCMRRKMAEQMPDSEQFKSVKSKKAKATQAKKKHSKVAKAWYKSQLAAFTPKVEEADEDEE
jgi:large subunit ribosomal protein L4e